LPDPASYRGPKPKQGSSPGLYRKNVLTNIARGREKVQRKEEHTKTSKSQGTTIGPTVLNGQPGPTGESVPDSEKKPKSKQGCRV